MSLSGSKQSSESKLDPQFKEAYLNNLASVQNTAANLKAREFAGFTPDQQAGFNVARQFSDPNSEVFTGMRTAFDTAGRVANYNPQNVTYNAYGGATVDPAAMAAQQGYNPTTGYFSSAGPATQYGGAQTNTTDLASGRGYTVSQYSGAQADPATLAKATGYTAQGYGGQTAAPANMFSGVGAGSSATAVGTGYDVDRFGGTSAGAVERFAGVSAGDAERAQAAQLARSSIRDVGVQGVSGADITSEALGQIAPQARANIRDVGAGSFLNQNIQQYMNPYTQAVT